LGIKLADTSDTALWFARAASALQCLAFILLAVALLWDGSAWSLAGLLVAITPMVLFVGSVLNPNGLEIAAAIALAAAVIRLARRPGLVTPWVWVALATSGAVTILAWQLGPVFAGIDLALLAGLLSRGELHELVREHRTAVFWTSAILAGAVAIWLVYGQFSGAEHSTIRLSLVRAHGGLSQLTAVLREAIGDFGLVNVPLPTPVRLVWWLLVIGLVALAVLLGRRRERVLMVVTVAVALVFPVLFYDWAYRFSGYPLQGRYVLPVLVLVPLLAGELIGRHSGDWRAGRSSLIPAGLIALTALVQTYAWWYASGFAAGRPRTLQFFDHASWSPPLGWTPWIAIAAVGAAALLGSAGTARVAARKGGGPASHRATRARPKDDPGRAGGRPGPREGGDARGPV
jgi:hypothetical protein